MRRRVPGAGGAEATVGEEGAPLLDAYADLGVLGAVETTVSWLEGELAADEDGHGEAPRHGQAPRRSKAAVLEGAPLSRQCASPYFSVSSASWKASSKSGNLF